MATTVSHAFSVFRQRLEITDLQEATVSTRQTAVRKAVERRLDVLDSFLTGSYRRRTMIAPLKEADVDVMMVLATHYYYEAGATGNPQANLLDKVRLALLETYTRTPSISRNGQAVSIRFTDFLVDVVPAFHRDGGGFLIPDSVGKKWIGTDPKAHVTLISEANQTHGQRLIPIIKMIKSWNRNAGSFFHSFHLEVLALQVFKDIRIDDDPSGIRFFFDKARSAVRGQNADPAGSQYNPDVGSYINTTARIEEATGKFQHAYEIALEAEQHNVMNRPWDAIGVWRRLLGDSFPVYG